MSSPTASKILSEAIQLLKEGGHGQYRHWFGELEPMVVQKNVLHVRCQQAAHKDYLVLHAVGLFEAAIKLSTGGEMSVQFWGPTDRDATFDALGGLPGIVRPQELYSESFINRIKTLGRQLCITERITGLRRQNWFTAIGIRRATLSKAALAGRLKLSQKHGRTRWLHCPIEVATLYKKHAPSILAAYEIEKEAHLDWFFKKAF